MSAQLTLTRSASLVSTNSTLVGSKEEAKNSKLSLAPSQNGLVDLEKQALTTSVPTVGILEKFVGAEKSIASTAQKAASMLTKPKAAVVKQVKNVALESFEVASKLKDIVIDFHSNDEDEAVFGGQVVGIIVGLGGMITASTFAVNSITGPTPPVAVYVGALVVALVVSSPGIFLSAFVGGKIAGYVAAKIK